MLQIASLQTAGPRGVQAFAGTALHAGVRQLVSARSPRRTRASLLTLSAFVLVPTGDGSCDHLDDQSISLPSEIVLTSGLFEVGRESPADIVVAVPTVSTRHAMLRLENSKVSVTDLSSTNGTYIDDEELVPLRAVEMSVGKEVTFGDMFLAKFKLEERT
ncbi:hypothetical protein WJX82_002699 [Trebouxia sp. C0006]